MNDAVVTGALDTLACCGCVCQSIAGKSRPECAAGPPHVVGDTCLQDSDQCQLLLQHHVARMMACMYA